MGRPAQAATTHPGRTPAGSTSATGTSGTRSRHWINRRVWLPAPLYAAVPWIYCALGAGALASGLFLPQPTWVLPYLFLLAVSALHLGLWCIVLRRRYRCRRLRRERLRHTAARDAFPDRAAM